MGATGRDLHIDTPLTNMVIGFEPQGFIVQDIFPAVPVAKQSDVYYKWTKGDFFRIPDTVRAPKTKGRSVVFNVSSDTYFAKNYALVHEEAFEDMANADQILKSRQKRVRALKNLLTLDWENRVASLITSGSNLGSYTTLSGTSQWSDYANSDPVNDVETGKEAIRSTTGLDTNLMIIGHAAYRKLIHHPDILDRIKYVQKGVVTADVLAAVFEVERILIGKAIKNTGEEELSDSFSDIWGDNVVLAHVTRAPDPDGKDPSLGYAFRWVAPLFGNRPWVAEIWNDPDGGNFENRRVQYYQDEKIIASELGYLIADTVA
jgi:hypothetical protein